MKHPAVYSDSIVAELQKIVDEYKPATVLDPFAGTGRIHELSNCVTVGVEIEPEWAQMHAQTIVGDATNLPFRYSSFDAVFTSPTFSNRMADSHVAKDGSYRRTYRHVLGRDLHPRNTGGMQWGEQYRTFHLVAWLNVERVLRPGGVFVLDIKDHQRNFQRQHVSNWHYKAITRLGFKLLDIRRVSVPHFKFGQNRDARYPERLLIFERTP